MKNKKLFSIILIFIFVFVLCGCGNKTNATKTNKGDDNKTTTTINNQGVTGEFSYDTEMLSEKEDKSYGYNNNLFYVNNLEFEVADPSVIYITEGEDAGWFYCYGTSDEIAGHGFQAWRSKDLSHWECTGVALAPHSWAINCYWAPEVIYDDGLYYMFFGAFNLLKNNRLYISVAVSESPKGPFEQPDGIRDANGNFLHNDKPVFDFSGDNAKVKALDDAFKAQYPNYGPSFAKNNFLDASPFIDPVTKEKYLYFSAYNDYGEGSLIYGVKMIDWFTPDYTTLKMLTIPGYNTVENGINSAFGEGIRLTEAGVNEGPFMIYHDGTYYLTLSIFGYTDPSYQVIQATSSSPLGDFTKVSPDDGGKVISSDTVNWSHITSAGHHSFVKMGDELFIAYHTFKNRTDISGGRALAVDRVMWTENSAGETVMYTNGPTWSIQPLPEFISGYKNIAGLATVTSNNTKEDSDVSLLTDGLIKYQEFDSVEEYEANEGKTEITLTFDDYKTVRSIMIYNSYEYDNTFVSINKLQMEVLTASGDSMTIEIKDLPFDWDWNFEDDYLFIRPGGAAIAEFDELPVKSIKIEVVSPEGSEQIAINEIYVLGKDAKCAGVSEFSEYSYEVTHYNSAHIEKNSKTFGSPKGSNLKTEYGYDLTHDDGTEDAYVEQTGPADQSCYFNAFYSYSFYVEAEFTVTMNEAFAYNNYLHDPYPKFGLQVSCDDGDAKNTIFFYVDAVGYNSKQVGVAQRMLDNSNWDWSATEQTVAVSDMSYTNGNYVKLGILRMGNDFYFLCNDKVVIHYASFNVFNQRQAAAPGFRCFSTAMKIKNYYASNDEEVILAKKEIFADKINGETLGDCGTFIMTSGWDLTGDKGEHPVATQSLGGDQYVYFKGVSGNKYYAEINLTVTKDLGDSYPKFGMVVRTQSNTFFYYIDGSGNYGKSRVGYVELDTSGNWMWGSSVEKDTASLKFTNGEYTKLGILRDGSTLKLYANDVLIFTVEDVREVSADSNLAIGALSFTTGIEIKDYYITTDTTRIPE